MALPENTPQEKPSNEGHKHEKREKPSTKVIVRRLPPSMTLGEFQTQVSPLPDYDYMYAIKGDMSLGENAFSRVYINFCNTEDIFMFKEKFDNYVFVDGKGHEYAAVVEFASFQKIPKKRGKPRPDPKLGTIESDPTFIEFVESLKRQPNQDEKVEFSYQPSTENKNDVSTPLLDYIKQRKLDRLKSREEKREERRRREMERKKLREEEKRKRFEENSPAKTVTIKQSKSDLEKIPEEKKIKNEEKQEKVEKFEKIEKVEKSPYKSKDYKVNTKPKPKYNKYEYEKRDYKSRTGYNRHYEDTRKKEDPKKTLDEQKPATSAKKGKKYSERREERKLEVKKAEMKKDESEKDGSEVKSKENQEKYKIKEEENIKDEKEERGKIEKVKEDKGNEEKGKIEKNKDEKCKIEKVKDEKGKDEKGKDEKGKDEKGKEEKGKEDKVKDDKEKKLLKEEKGGSEEREKRGESDDQEKVKNKENDPRVQRRIRNKDRPTMQLYQPGMLSKRRQKEDDGDVKEAKEVKEVKEQNKD